MNQRGKTAVAEEAINLREQMENEGATDRHEKLQPSVIVVIVLQLMKI